jgi:hypothetical protein
VIKTSPVKRSNPFQITSLSPSSETRMSAWFSPPFFAEHNLEVLTFHLFSFFTGRCRHTLKGFSHSQLIWIEAVDAFESEYVELTAPNQR